MKTEGKRKKKKGKEHHIIEGKGKGGRKTCEVPETGFPMEPVGMGCLNTYHILMQPNPAG